MAFFLNGPDDLEQLMRYPELAARTLAAEPGRRQRLMHWLSYSFEISSDFSGVGSWEDTLRWHLLELAYQLDRPPPTLLLWRMCDMDTTCLNILSSRTPGPPGHACCLRISSIVCRWGNLSRRWPCSPWIKGMPARDGPRARTTSFPSTAAARHNEFLVMMLWELTC